MSETETIRGTMRLVEKTVDETTEDVCRRLVIKQDATADELPTWASTWQEYLLDSFGGYTVYKDEVYDITDWKDLAYGDVFEASENADGTISFFLQYYNGGCGMAEALEYALENLKKHGY